MNWANAACGSTPHGRPGSELGHVHPAVGDLAVVDPTLRLPEQLPQPPLGQLRLLPAWLDLGEPRAVHACWDDEQLAVFAGGRREHGPFTAVFLRAASDRRTAMYHAVDVTMSV
jgi:hypothetical protein